MTAPNPTAAAAIRGAVAKLSIEDLLRRLEISTGEHESAEGGLREINSPAFTIQIRDDVVAAAGYRTWPSRTAHLSVLTAPENRGRGEAWHNQGLFHICHDRRLLLPDLLPELA